MRRSRYYATQYPDEGEAALREALTCYTGAAEQALESGRVRFSHDVMELADALNDPAPYSGIFQLFLERAASPSDRYLALVDLANGLSRRADPSAESYFKEAVAMRPPRDSVEAHVLYAKYLIAAGRQQEALAIPNRFSAEERPYHPTVALLRQRLMRDLGLDTGEADAEIDDLQKRLGPFGVKPPNKP